jgi:hypothetical protein
VQEKRRAQTEAPAKESIQDFVASLRYPKQIDLTAQERIDETVKDILRETGTPPTFYSWTTCPEGKSDQGGELLADRLKRMTFAERFGDQLDYVTGLQQSAISEFTPEPSEEVSSDSDGETLPSENEEFPESDEERVESKLDEYVGVLEASPTVVFEAMIELMKQMHPTLFKARYKWMRQSLDVVKRKNLFDDEAIGELAEYLEMDIVHFEEFVGRVVEHMIFLLCDLRDRFECLEAEADEESESYDPAMDPNFKISLPMLTAAIQKSGANIDKDDIIQTFVDAGYMERTDDGNALFTQKGIDAGMGVNVPVDEEGNEVLRETH